MIPESTYYLIDRLSDEQGHSKETIADNILSYANSGYPIENKSIHIKLVPNFLEPNHCDETVQQYMMKMQMDLVDKIDNEIVEMIKRQAMQDGITDLYLIDKGFIMSAIKEKMVRDKERTQELTIEQVKQRMGKPVYYEPLVDFQEDCGMKPQWFIVDEDMEIEEWMSVGYFYANEPTNKE